MNSAITCTIPDIPTGNADRTVSLWTKSSSSPRNANLEGLFEWGLALPRQAFGISTQFAPLVYQAKSFGGGNDVSSGQVADGKWHHLVATYANSTISIYVDGVLRGSGVVPISTGFSTAKIGVGVEGGNNFSGQLDDIRIYRRALSASEVAGLFVLESL